MSIEYKDITKCEQLSDLPDGSYIAVVSDGELKLISKENTKFGGGSITTFYAVSSIVKKSAPSGGNPVAVQKDSDSSCTLTHEDGTKVTAQEVYDAYMAGSVKVKYFADPYENLAENGIFCEESMYYLAAVSSTALFDPTDVVYCFAPLHNFNVSIGTMPGWGIK